MHHSKFLTGVAFAALVASAPMAVAQNSPETGQGTQNERYLTCEAEFRALQETITNEPEYAEVSTEFERLIAQATDPEIRADEGVCYVNFVRAQQMLAEAGLVLEGYTDEATIYETIEAAQAAGAFTTAEAEEALERTRVTVQTRPARVAVTPQEARVLIEREATEVDVTQRPSEILVEQPQSTVNVQQAQPDIDVNQPEPEVDVQAAAPEVQVEQPAPDINVQQAQPEIDVTQSRPQVEIEQPQPEVTIRQHQPEVEITQPQPSIRVEQQQPEVAVVQPEPEVNVETAEPVVTVDQAEPDVDVDYARPDVNVTQREPEVEVSASQPQVSVSETQPEVSVTQGQPDVEVSQSQPQVNVDQARPEVQVTQDRAQVTASMDEAQVSVEAEQGAQVQATREEGVAVSVDREDEAEIVIGEVREMPEQIANFEPIALEEIEFRFDSAELTDIGMGNVEDAVNALEDGMRAVLVGYASPIGDAEYNRQLSRERVQTVREAMMERGVSADQINVYAAGEDRTELPAANAEQRRTEENRRVDILILPEEAFEGQGQG